MSVTARQAVAGLNVSRETLEALEAFSALVLRWNSTINLVSKAALPALWERHVIDSAQLFTFCPPHARRWIDIGSGGGFPGLVVSILAREALPNLQVTLVESDQRKSIFLQQAVQLLGLTATVLNNRIESIPSLEAEVLSARALAPLDELLGYASPHLGQNGIALFPKGARHNDELTEARKHWRFGVTIHSSLSDPAAAILEIRNINREP